MRHRFPSSAAAASPQTTPLITMLRRSAIVVLAAAAAAVTFASGAKAQDVQDRTIRFGHLNNADHAVSFGVKRFAELVAAKSGGKMKVLEFPASQLGNEMQQQSAL